MAAATPALRQSESSNAFLLIFGIVGLAALGGIGGLMLALGELDAFWICLAVLGSLAVLFDFRIGAVLIIVLLPIESTSLFPHGIGGYTGLNPLNVLIAGTFASWFLRRHAKTDARFLPRPLFWLYLLPIVFAGVIGSRHAADFYPTLYDTAGGGIHFKDAAGYLRDMAMKPLMMVLMALLIGAAVAKSKKPERFIGPVIAASWVMSLLLIIYVAASGMPLGLLAAHGESTAFYGVLGMHANDLGRLYAVAYALLLFTWAETRHPALKTLLLLTMGVLVLALMLTFSRGAFLGFMLVNLLYVLWKFNAKTLALVVLGVFCAAWLLPGVVYDRATMGFGADANTVSAGRIDTIWLPLLPEVFKSPIWGNGLSSIGWSSAMWTGQMLVVGHPHNAYLEALLDFGFVGFGLLLAFYWHVWKGFRDLGSNAFISPALRGFFQGATAGLLSFLVTNFAGSSFVPRPEYAFLWIAIGMMYGQLARRPAA